MRGIKRSDDTMMKAYKLRLALDMTLSEKSVNLYQRTVLFKEG
jgi:hypothetical protein